MKKKIKFSRLRKSVSKANFWSSLKQTFVDKSIPLKEKIGVRKIDILTHSDKKSGAAAAGAPFTIMMAEDGGGLDDQ